MWECPWRCPASGQQIETEASSSVKYLGEFLSLLEENIHDFAHVGDGVQSIGVGLVRFRTIVDNKNSRTLVKNT